MLLANRRIDAIVLGCISIFVFFRIDRLMTGTIFYYDEWSFILDREISIDSLLQPHNGHLSTLPVSIYLFLMESVGLNHYRAYRWVGILVHLLVILAIYSATRTRGRVLSFCAVSVFCLMGSGWQNSLWPFQIGMMGSVATGLFAFALLEKDQERPGITATLITMSLMCAGGGIPVYAAVLVGNLLRKRRRTIRGLLAVGVVYGAWYVTYGESQGSLDNFSRIPRYILDSAVSTASGLGSKGQVFGAFIVGAVSAGLVIQRRTLRHDPVLIAALIAMILNWVLTGYSRAQLGEPGASRYVYVGAAYLVVVIVRLLPAQSDSFAKYGYVAVALFLAVSSWSLLESGASGLRNVSSHLRTELFVQESLRNYVDGDYRLDLQRAPNVYAGKYFAAIDQYGSPVAPLDVTRRSASARLSADRVMFEILVQHMSIQPVAETPCDPQDLVSEIEPHETVYLILNGAEQIYTRRFGDEFQEATILSVPNTKVVSLEFPRDDFNSDWIIQSSTGDGFLGCR